MVTPPPCPSPPLVVPQGGWGTVTCSTQNFSLQLTVLLWQNHHPKVLPKAFQWKVVSMCKSSRSSGAGPRKFTPSWSRSRSPYIGSPLNVSCAEFSCKCACTVAVRFQRGGGGGRHLVTVPCALRSFFKKSSLRALCVHNVRTHYARTLVAHRVHQRAVCPSWGSPLWGLKIWVIGVVELRKAMKGALRALVHRTIKVVLVVTRRITCWMGSLLLGVEKCV